MGLNQQHHGRSKSSASPSPCTQGEGWGEGSSAVERGAKHHAGPLPAPLPEYRERETRNRRRATLALAALSASATLLAGVIGCIGDPPPFDPRAAQTSERLASRDVPTPPMRPLPTTLRSPYLGDRSPSPNAGAMGPARPTTSNGTGNGRASTETATTAPATGPAMGLEPQVRMSLQEIVQRAVANNLDVRVAGYQPAIDQTRVTEAEARFDPTFFVQTTWQEQNQPVAINQAGALNGKIEVDTLTAQGGIQQNLESGGSISLSQQATLNHYPHELTGTQVSPNPYYENEIALQISQPLLRDFGNDINRARIVIARNNQRISLLEFRKQIEETISDTEKAYWQLVQGEREVRIQEELLDRTIDTARFLLSRVGERVTRVQISQANSQIESRRATLIAAKAKVQDLSDQLKRLMNDPDFPTAGRTMILPAAKPLTDPVQFDLDEQIDTGLINRFELAEQLLRIDNAGTAIPVAKNNLLPDLTFSGQMNSTGLDAGVDSSFANELNFNNVTYQIGFRLEVPIGNRAARAVYQRALLQRQQAIESYRSLIEQVTLDVKQAARDVKTQWDRMDAARSSVYAAEDSLKALVERREVEELSPAYIDTVLNSQERLAEAQRTEAEAVASYNIAISHLEQTKGTLLKYNNIVMQEDRVPFTQAFYGKKK